MARQFSLLQMIVVVLLFGMALTLAVTFLASAKRSARRNSCASNLKQIGVAMMMYADVPANKIFPTHGTRTDQFADTAPIDSLMLLYNGYVSDRRVFDCPADPLSSTRHLQAITRGSFIPSSPISFGYDPGHIPDTDTAVAADRKATGTEGEFHGDGRNVLRASGTVIFSTTVENVGKDPSGNEVLIDDDIFSLNPARKREFDSYIRR